MLETASHVVPVHEGGLATSSQACLPHDASCSYDGPAVSSIQPLIQLPEPAPEARL